MKVTETVNAVFLVNPLNLTQKSGLQSHLDHVSFYCKMYESYCSVQQQNNKEYCHHLFTYAPNLSLTAHVSRVL